MMLEYLDNIVPFIELVAKDENRTDEVTKSAIGVIG
jgi:hypothetical protein